MSPRAVMDGCGKSRTHRDSISGPSSPPRVIIPTDLPMPPFMETEGLIITFITIKGLSLQNTSDTVCVVKVGIQGVPRVKVTTSGECSLC